MDLCILDCLNHGKKYGINSIESLVVSYKIIAVKAFNPYTKLIGAPDSDQHNTIDFVKNLLNLNPDIYLFIMEFVTPERIANLTKSNLLFKNLNNHTAIQQIIANHREARATKLISDVITSCVVDERQKVNLLVKLSEDN